MSEKIVCLENEETKTTLNTTEGGFSSKEERDLGFLPPTTLVSGKVYNTPIHGTMMYVVAIEACVEPGMWRIYNCFSNMYMKIRLHRKTKVVETKKGNNPTPQRIFSQMERVWKKMCTSRVSSKWHLEEYVVTYKCD